MVPNRVAAVRGYLERMGLDAILVTSIQSIRYLSGFTGSDGVLVVSCDGGWFLTDSRYRSQADEQVAGFNVVEYRRKFEETAVLLQEQGFGKVGFEAVSVTVAQYKVLMETLSGVELLPLPGDFETIRSVKDQGELGNLGRIAELSSQSFMDLIPEIRPGTTERRLALSLEWRLREAGAAAASFSFIVASGSRGALPHAVPTNRAVVQGDLVTFDFGGVLEGYCSDETVTVAVGSVDARQREVYQVVKSAHDRAIDRVKPGISCREVDAVARDYIGAKGFAEYFGHGTGHGVGLEVHEKPVLSPRSEEILEEGMVVTIEPGIYIPGWGGVRIEDTICVTHDGCRILTKVPKELMVL